MKKVFLLSTVLLFCAAFSFAQSPQLINYQGVARDVSGGVLASTSISVKFIITDGSSTEVYNEYQDNLTTNQFGLFNTQIGGGTPNSGSGLFENITWANGGNHNLEVLLDDDGGNNSYNSMGTSQLVSVPYALYAETSGTSGSTGPTGPMGLQGSAGQNGLVGATGATGQNGTNGVTGTTGSIGLQGATGAQGATGQNGLIGATGPIGSGGAMGVTGPTGPQGPAGSGGLSGGGDSNKLVRWTPTGSVLGNSQIRDDGSRIGIGIDPLGTAKLYLLSGNNDYGALFKSANSGSIALSGISQGTSGATYGIVGDAGASSSGRGVSGTGGYAGVDGGSPNTGVRGSGGVYNFYAYGSGLDYGSASSIRWKENIYQIDSPLEKVMSLRGVYYDWKKDKGGKHAIGFIAEKVAEVLPEIVAFEKDGSGFVSGMDYSKVTPLLVEAIKAQQKMIEELMEGLRKAQAEISDLKK
jgi:hypothetical protein